MAPREHPSPLGRRHVPHRRRGACRPRVRPSLGTPRLFGAYHRSPRGVGWPSNPGVAPAGTHRMVARQRLPAESAEQNAECRNPKRQPCERGRDSGIRGKARGTCHGRALAARRHWRANSRAVKGFGVGWGVITPDDLFEGVSVAGPVVVFDDDHYYLGGVLAEKLRNDGHEVILITPAERVSAWTVNTLEQYSIQKRVLELGIEVLLNRNVIEFDGARVVAECTFTGRQSAVTASSVVTLTARQPNEALALELAGQSNAMSAAGITSVTSIGDCWAPSTIAAAVYAGHRHAREFDLLSDNGVGFRRELTALDDV